MKQYKSIRKAMPYKTVKDRQTVYVALTVMLYSRLEGYLGGHVGYDVKLKETVMEICDEVMDVSQAYPEEISKGRRDEMLVRWAKYLLLLEKGEKDREIWEEAGKEGKIFVENV